MYERKSPDAPRVEKAQTVIYVRNGSQLPVEVKQLAYSIHTQWWVPVLGSKLVSKPVPGTEPIRAFVNDLRIPPRRTWNNKTYPYEFDLAHTVPERAQQLDLIQGVRSEIDWLLLVDRRARLRTVPGNSPNSAAVAANAAGQPC